MEIHLYFIVKTIHILSATILFGTGIGIAFFMFASYFTNDIHEKLYAARNTVLADYLFTLPAGVIQPLTGFWLIWQSGFTWTDWWLVVTYALYLIALACWLPVVWIQIRLKNILIQCTELQTELPANYHKLFKLWFLLGWPAFTGLVVIFFLMVFKPM